MDPSPIFGICYKVGAPSQSLLLLEVIMMFGTDSAENASSAQPRSTPVRDDQATSPPWAPNTPTPNRGVSTPHQNDRASRFASTYTEILPAIDVLPDTTTL